MKTKNIVVIAVLTVALLLFACASTEEAPAAEDVEAPSAPSEGTAGASDGAAEEQAVIIAGDVSILGPEGFDPMEFSVKVGEGVTFVNANADDVDVISEVVLVFKEEFKVGGAVDSPKIQVGESYTHVFESAGTYEYWTVGYGVKGTITVFE